VTILGNDSKRKKKKSRAFLSYNIEDVSERSYDPDTLSRTKPTLKGNYGHHYDEEPMHQERRIRVRKPAKRKVRKKNVGNMSLAEEIEYLQEKIASKKLSKMDLYGVNKRLKVCKAKLKREERKRKAGGTHGLTGSNSRRYEPLKQAPFAFHEQKAENKTGLSSRMLF